MTQTTTITGHQGALLGLTGDGSRYADDTSDVPVRDVVDAAVRFALLYSRSTEEIMELRRLLVRWYDAPAGMAGEHGLYEDTEAALARGE